MSKTSEASGFALHSAVLERIPRWAASFAFLLLVILLVISYSSGKRISWSPFGFVDDTGVELSIPQGAVVAFADAGDGIVKRNCSELGGGWVDFGAADGRFIIGAGGLDGTQYVAGTVGGVPDVVLTLENIPSHTHEYKMHRDRPGQCGLSGCGNHNSSDITKTESTGGNSDGKTVPHQNLPPYIALTWCKKT